MALYVSGLNYQATEEDILTLFSNYGEVTKVTLALDRETGKSKGTAFVEMVDESRDDAAISELNGIEFMSKNIRVEKQRPREDTRSTVRRPSASYKR
jgi:RNA recognition motif-containing protein